MYNILHIYIYVNVFRYCIHGTHVAFLYYSQFLYTLRFSTEVQVFLKPMTLVAILERLLNFFNNVRIELIINNVYVNNVHICMFKASSSGSEQSTGNRKTYYRRENDRQLALPLNNSAKKNRRWCLDRFTFFCDIPPELSFWPYCLLWPVPYLFNHEAPCTWNATNGSHVERRLHNLKLI